MSANASIGYCSRCNSWILWRCVDTQSDLELRGEWPLILNGNFEFAKADGDTKRAFNGQTPITSTLKAKIPNGPLALHLRVAVRRPGRDPLHERTIPCTESGTVRPP